MAVAFAQPMDLVANTLYKGPAVALEAYKIPAAGRVMGVVEEKSEGAGIGKPPKPSKPPEIRVDLPETLTIKNILQAINNNGLTKDDFLTLMKKSATELTPDEAKILDNIRNTVPNPEVNTPIQKVLNPSHVNGYLDGSFMNFNGGKIGGCITTVEDVSKLTSPKQIFYGLRMDYPGTPFSPTDGFNTVIRFTSKDAGNIKIPYGDSMPNPAGGRVSKMTDPFTGNGFTSATNGQIIPEFYSDGLNLTNGAQMIKISSDGIETLVAVFNEDLERFIIVK